MTRDEMIDGHPQRLMEAHPLVLELAVILQTVAFQGAGSGPHAKRILQELSAMKRPAPLYLEQALILSKDDQLRSRMKLILSANDFPARTQKD